MRTTEKMMKPNPPIRNGNIPRPSRPVLPISSRPDLAMKKKIVARVVMMMLRLIVTDIRFSFSFLDLIIAVATDILGRQA
jgi:hypothetical protein